MRLYTTTEGIGREQDDGSVALVDCVHDDLGGLLLVDGLAGLDALATAPTRAVHPLAELELMPPVPRPGKFLVVGLNYRSHLEEVAEGIGVDLSGQANDPLAYVIPGSAVAATDALIRLPRLAPEQVDYEGELAVIVGTQATEVDAAAGWSHVAGLSVVNDVSARDLQTRAMKDPSLDVAISKGFDTFKPLGPCLVTADEFSEPLDLGLRTWVNGELRQDARTTEFFHSVGEVIAFISARMTLEPGDVICTGSPRGVGMWRGGLWLRPGDTVEIEVERVGRLVSTVG